MSKITKHASIYCTECLSETGEYKKFKVLSQRIATGKNEKTGKKTYAWKATGIYQCEGCQRIAVGDDLYKELRTKGKRRDVLYKLSTYIESN